MSDGFISVMDAEDSEIADAVIKTIRGYLTIPHNHPTREIREPGTCPGCDSYWYSQNHPQEWEYMYCAPDESRCPEREGGGYQCIFWKDHEGNHTVSSPTPVSRRLKAGPWEKNLESDNG